jgi:Cellulose biosynthesis protein BcsS
MPVWVACRRCAHLADLRGVGWRGFGAVGAAGQVAALRAARMARACVRIIALGVCLPLGCSVALALGNPPEAQLQQEAERQGQPEHTPAATGAWAMFGALSLNAASIGSMSSAMPFMPAFSNDALDATRRTVMFASLESGPGQRFIGSGIKHAPFGTLGASGLRVMARGATSQWQDRRREFAIDSKSDGALLVGVDQMTGRGAFGLYLGMESATTIWPERVRRGNRLTAQERSATTEGLRIEASLWDHPTPETLLQIGAAMGSARSEAWGRVALGHSLSLPQMPEMFGYRFTNPPFFIGPEAELVLARDYTKWRVGGHVTGLKLLGFNLRLAAGREQASGNMRGLYVTAGIHWFR